MSTFSTYQITKEDAIKILSKKLLSMDTEDLETALDNTFGYDTKYIFQIVEEYPKNSVIENYKTKPIK